MRLPIYTLSRDHLTRFFPLLSTQGQPAAAVGLRLDRSGRASREGCLPGQPFLQLTRSVRQHSPLVRCGYCTDSTCRCMSEAFYHLFDQVQCAVP